LVAVSTGILTISSILLLFCEYTSIIYNPYNMLT
jgi:hypothetical protein